MNLLIWLAVAVAGGLGAAVRLFLDGLIRDRGSLAYPVGTTVINVTGSLVLGLITGLVIAHLLPGDWGIILGGGLMSGYTTFSTASIETVRLFEERRYRAASANALGMLVISAAAASLGLWLGAAL